MNVLGFDGEVQEVVLSITVVASLVPPTIGSRPPFVMFYFLVIITFCPPSKKFHFKTYRDWILHLLPDPLGNKVVAEDDDGGAGNEP